MAEKSTGVATREGQRLSRREAPSIPVSPIGMLERFADEMERVFEDFGLGSSWPMPRRGRNAFGAPLRGSFTNLWMPDVEVYQRHNELVVRADLPGMKREDVKVDATDSAITIQGERRQEEQREGDGFYRSERSYGSFHRSIPLPEGAIVDQAKAIFKDGVLEITMPAPSEQVTRGRRLEITEGAEPRK